MGKMPISGTVCDPQSMKRRSQTKEFSEVCCETGAGLRTWGSLGQGPGVATDFKEQNLFRETLGDTMVNKPEA